jgi:hypothetical protein
VVISHFSRQGQLHGIFSRFAPPKIEKNHVLGPFFLVE